MVTITIVMGTQRKRRKAKKNQSQSRYFAFPSKNKKTREKPNATNTKVDASYYDERLEAADAQLVNDTQNQNIDSHDKDKDKDSDGEDLMDNFDEYLSLLPHHTHLTLHFSLFIEILFLTPHSASSSHLTPNHTSHHITPLTLPSPHSSSPHLTPLPPSDYKAMPQLDKYEDDGLDTRQYDDMSYAQRLSAERAIRQREKCAIWLLLSSLIKYFSFFFILKKIKREAEERLLAMGLGGRRRRDFDDLEEDMTPQQGKDAQRKHTQEWLNRQPSALSITFYL